MRIETLLELVIVPDQEELIKTYVHLISDRSYVSVADIDAPCVS